MSELRVICRGGGGYREHTPAELAHFHLMFDQEILNAIAVARKTPAIKDEPLLRSKYVVERSRSGSNADNRKKRTPVGEERRARRGRTFVIPACPRCGRDEIPVRDETLTRYMARTKDTPLAGALDVAHVGMV